MYSVLLLLLCRLLFRCFRLRSRESVGQFENIEQYYACQKHSPADGRDEQYIIGRIIRDISVGLTGEGLSYIEGGVLEAGNVVKVFGLELDMGYFFLGKLRAVRQLEIAGISVDGIPKYAFCGVDAVGSLREQRSCIP